MSVLLLLVSLGLVGLCAIFVAAEFALITVNRTTVERHAARGDKQAAGVLLALKSFNTQLSGSQVGITITNLAIGFLAEPTLIRVLHEPLISLGVHGAAATSVATIVGLAIATVVTMVLGELVPKYVAIAIPFGTARRVQAVIRLFTQVMRGPIIVFNGSAAFILRRFGMEPREELASARSADELASLVRRSADKGTLPRETARMLERSLAFGELTALDVMTPRVRVYTINVDDPVSAVIALARRTGFSRFPVVKNSSLDDVIGTVHIKKAVSVPEADRETTLTSQIMQEPVVVPSSIELDPLLKRLRGGGLQMAIIIDEFGGADGIVTIEDLIEELVGEVYDEHDRSRTLIRKRNDGGWLVSGLLRPDEIGQELGIFLPEDREYETIGGLAIDVLERVPKVGETATIPAIDRDAEELQVILTIERMDGRRVDRMRLQLEPKPGDSLEGEETA
ncbi:MAG: hemolysin family protein [Patescibacteria group bacterium]|nr:hemolysin family protein [Patescibacteria group bacterium]